MRLLQLSALALAVETAFGYQDTSPFFMFSTSEILLPSSNFQTASSIETSISHALSQCPSDYYIIISQPGVRYSDYIAREQTPTLAKHLSHSDTPSHVRSTIAIPEVVESIDVSVWERIIRSKCKAHSEHFDILHSFEMPARTLPKPYLLSVDLMAPTGNEAEFYLKKADQLLDVVLESLGSANFTVLYTTTPKTTKSYSRNGEGSEEYIMDETELDKTLHLDLKRDLSSHTFAKRENITLPEGALFHRYQFLTPGIFMGFLVGFILLMILYVGVSALTSLQVSYAAFDKEQGQLAAKRRSNLCHLPKRSCVS